jgi:5-methylcytosine-specific restriction enzyme B
MTTVLTAQDRTALGLVLERHARPTHKGGPGLLSLSLYSSELKSLKQIHSHLKSIEAGTGIPATEDRTRNRYFRSLEINGLISGTPTAPALTSAGVEYLDIASNDDASEAGYWQQNGLTLELVGIRYQVAKMQRGEDVPDTFRRTWFNTQTFFDLVPEADLPTVLADPTGLRFLFGLNSHGWEIGRFFTLSNTEREAVREAHAKCVRDDFAPAAGNPIDTAAGEYAQALSGYQLDVRFRLSAFLNAFNLLRQELGSTLPRLDRSLIVRATAAKSSAGTAGSDLEGTMPSNAPRQLIVSGCPGSGKSFYVDALVTASGATVFKTQFHPETSYFDFVGSYKPQPVYEAPNAAAALYVADGTAYPKGRPIIDYQFGAGPLILAMCEALKSAQQNVVLQIEELNRGNPAAIFGDVLQLLDRDDSGTSRYGVLPSQELSAYLKGQGVASADGLLRLPPNLYIWATMNSADQGVFPVDSAFRRRWSFKYMGYSTPCAYASTERQLQYGGELHDWDLFRGRVNDRLVELGVHEDKLIGPYFLTPAQLGSPEDVLEKLILYLWDDVLRFRQGELFVASSFSHVQSNWASGKGAPFKIPMASLSKQDSAEAVEVGAESLDDPAGATASESPISSAG